MTGTIDGSEIDNIVEPTKEQLDEIRDEALQRLAKEDEGNGDKSKATRANYYIWLEDVDGRHEHYQSATDYDALEDCISRIVTNDWYEYTLLDHNWWEALQAVPKDFRLVIGHRTEATSDSIDRLLIVQRVKS